MKTGKEIKYDDFKDYGVIFGSVNNKHPKAVYVNISAWFEPRTDEQVSYSRVIKDINKLVKQHLYNGFYLNPSAEFLKDRTIVDLDIRESGIKFGKRSFMNCEITLFTKVDAPLASDAMIVNLTSIVKTIIDKVFDSNKNFKFHKKKK